MWKCFVASYQHGIVLLKSKEDLNDNEIISFQHKMDNFFHTCIEIHGEGVVKNYAHTLVHCSPNGISLTLAESS